jgi:hypothetical protein
MSVTYLGSLSIGDALPGAVAVAAAGVAGIGLALPDIQARLAALASFSPLPVDFAAQLALALQMVASVQTSIALGLSPPSIALQIAIIAALVLELEAAIVAISVQLDIVLDFQALLGAAGIHAYAYAGQVQDLGSEMATELAGGVPGGAPTDASNALVLVTTTPATWTAMGQIFQVTP